MTEINPNLIEMGQHAKQAAQTMSELSTKEKNTILMEIADALEASATQILAANQQDLDNAKANNLPLAMQERLTLNQERIQGMANGVRKIARLADPLMTVDREWISDDGLRITQRRVPLGVIGIIYESRPNVTIDASALCLKAGNVVILRGGSDAFNSNQQLVNIVQDTLEQKGYSRHFVQLVTDLSHEVAGQLMRLNAYLDCLIPRGGAGLIQRVMTQATVPVIETGTGNCHLYIHQEADLHKAVTILVNGKTQRNSVCNALESLIIDAGLREHIPQILTPLLERGVEIRGDETICQLIPQATLATEADYATEFLDDTIAVKVAEDYHAAISHIRQFSTHHSDAIVTENYSVAQDFMNDIDSAVVYVNASTRFTDGEMFGFGGEMGISTQKLHARGPMGLDALTSYKYTVQGNGQIRQ